MEKNNNFFKGQAGQLHKPRLPRAPSQEGPG